MRLCIGTEKQAVSATRARQIARGLDAVGRVLNQNALGDPMWEAARILDEVANLIDGGPEPRCYRPSGLAPQPPAAVDQLEDVSYHHSVSAQAAISAATLLILDLVAHRASTPEGGKYLANILLSALRLLGVGED